MSEDYGDARRAARDELNIQKQRDAFWAKLFSTYPVARGHQEVARSLMQKNMAKMADMDQDAAIEFLGNAIKAEIGRRTRRDADQVETQAYSGGPSGPHGHSTDGVNTFDPDDSRFDHDPKDNSMGARIKANKERRRSAQRDWGRTDDGDRREHGRR